MRKVFPVLFTFLILLSTLQYNVSADDKYESVSAFVKMQKRDLKVTVYYYEGNDQWARHVLDLTIKVLPIIEDSAGFLYPYEYDVKIYETSAEKVWCPVCGQNNGENGVWLATEVNDRTIIHENAHFWTYLYVNQWMQEGYANFYTYAVLEKLNGAKVAENWRNSISESFIEINRTFDWFLNNNYYTMPKPSNWSKEDQKRMDFCALKGFIFVYRIYENFGLNILQELNYYLYLNNISTDSQRYKELLEEKTGENLDDFFSGWIFEGEYKKSRLEKEIEDKISKAKNSITEFESIIKKTSNLNIRITNSNIAEAEEAYENYELQKAQRLINNALREIERDIKDYEEKLEKLDDYTKIYEEKKKLYESKNFIFEETLPKKYLQLMKNNLDVLNYEVFIKGPQEFDKEMKRLKEFYPQLSEKYHEVKSMLSSEFSVEKVLLDVENHIGNGNYEDALERLELIKNTLDKYEDVKEKWEKNDIFTRIGFSLVKSPISKADIENAKSSINNGYFEKSLEFSNYVLSTLESARNIGLLVVAGASIFLIIIIIVVFIVVRKLISKKGKVGQ